MTSPGFLSLVETELAKLRADNKALKYALREAVKELETLGATEQSCPLLVDLYPMVQE